MKILVKVRNGIARLVPAFFKGIRSVDPVIFTCTSILTLMSMMTIIGGLDKFGKGKILMQVAMTVVGLIFMVIIANIDYQLIASKFSILLFICSVLLLGFTLVIGVSEGGNQSWIRIPIVGITIQPSEFVKASFILTFSRHLELVKDKINHPKNVLALAAHALVIVGCILLSGDLGVALVYIGIILVMLFCAGLSGWYFLAIAALTVIVFPFLWDHLALYQQQRILVGFNPSLDPLGKGHQPLMSRSAIMNGGFFGKGMFGGDYYRNLFAAHTDFIYGTYCEKFGFVGGILLIAVMLALVIRLIYIARRSRDACGAFICAGIAGMIVVQTTENIGMCLAMLPVVGITLPFVSYGGSSMLAIYITIGMAHSVSSHRIKNYAIKDSF